MKCIENGRTHLCNHNPSQPSLAELSYGVHSHTVVLKQNIP